MTLPEFTTHLRNLIAKDELEEVMKQLKAFLAESPQLDAAIQQSGRLAGINHQIRQGTISHADASRGRNQVRAGLLSFLQELEDQTEAAPKMQQEAQQTIQHLVGKNIISNSTIHVSGNLNIGDQTVNQQADKIYNIEQIDKADFS